MSIRKSLFDEEVFPMVLKNIPFGIWFSMSNGTLLSALLIALGIGFVVGVVVMGYLNGRRK